MASFLSLSQHIRLCEPAAAVLVIVSGDVVVLYHSDPVGQNMVYSQVCRLSESTTLVLLAGLHRKMIIMRKEGQNESKNKFYEHGNTEENMRT
jgi:hypothetical protein